MPSRERNQSESRSESTWARSSESGFESRLPSCERSQSESGSESPCKLGYIDAEKYHESLLLFILVLSL